MQNSSSESQSPGFSGSSNGGLGLSESSAATIPDSECKNGSLEKSVKCELHDSSGSKWASQAPAEDNIFPTAHDLENLDQLDNDENEKKTVQATKVGTLLRQKRLRKPTKRYIEEFSDPKLKHVAENEKILSYVAKDKRLKIRSHDELRHERALTLAPKESFSETITQATSKDIEELSDSKSKCVIERQRTPVAASKDKRLKIRSRNELHHVRAVKSAPREESLAGTSTQAPFESRPRRGRPKKCLPLSVGILFSSIGMHSIISPLKLNIETHSLSLASMCVCKHVCLCCMA